MHEYVKPTLAKIYDYAHKINLKNNLTINGEVNSIILTKNMSKWGLTGNWNIKLSSYNRIRFDSNITGINGGDSTRAYRLFDFSMDFKGLEMTSKNTLLIDGKIDISIKNKITNLNIPIKIELNKNNTMNLFFKDKIVYEHFGKKPIQGIIKSIKVGNNLSYLWKNKYLKYLLDPNGKEQLIQEILYNNNDNNTSRNKQNTMYNKSNFVTIHKSVIIIPENAGIKNIPSFIPGVINVTRGNDIFITNKDSIDHTVISISGETSNNATYGTYFNTGYIHPLETKIISTTKIKEGYYPFGCSLHSFMKGMINIKKPLNKFN